MSFSHWDRHYLKIAMPSALEGVFMIFLSAADIIMVGALGTAAVAAVSIFTQPRMMLLCVTRSMGAALTILVSQKYGKGDWEEIKPVYGRTLLLGTVVLGIAHIMFFLHLADILTWMGAEASYLDWALEYGNLALVGVFLTSLATIIQSVLLGLGHTGAVLQANLQGNVLNVIGNALFIFGLGPFPELGVLGAAVGTVIGTSWTLAVTLYMMSKEKGLGRLEFLPNMAYLKDFGRIFGGVFSEQGFERVGMVLYTRMVAELGVLPYAVHAICMNFCDFYYSFAGGLGKASMILAGHAKGAASQEDRDAVIRVSRKWSFIFSVASFALTYVFREEIFSLYSGDGEALVMGAVIMAFVAVVSFPEAHSLTMAGILRGSGQTACVAMYSFVSIAVFRPIITAFLLYQCKLGLWGAWLALCIDQSTRALCAEFFLRRLPKISRSRA